MVSELTHIDVEPVRDRDTKHNQRRIPRRPIVRAQAYPAHYRAFDRPSHSYPVLIELDWYRQNRKQERETEKSQDKQVVITITTVGEIAQTHIERRNKQCKEPEHAVMLIIQQFITGAEVQKRV